MLPRADGSDPDAFHVEVVYAITPETEHSTHDFWAVARDFALDDQGVSDFLAESNRTVVLQDVAALDVLERVIADRARRATRSCRSTSTPAGWPPGGCWPGWPSRARPRPGRPA